MVHSRIAYLVTLAMYSFHPLKKSTLEFLEVDPAAQTNGLLEVTQRNLDRWVLMREH